MIVLYSILTLGLIGFVGGIILNYAARKFAVAVDPRIEKLANVLPGANCGACGYASCIELAKAVLKGEVASNSCIAGGHEVQANVSEIIGSPGVLPAVVRKTAVVQCKGGKGVAKEKFDYTGIENCSASILISNGPKACSYGCLGLGDCKMVCPFFAITMGKDGIPIIDETKCTACGKCVEICPRDIITLIPREQDVYLACVSMDKAKKVREVCSAGCIACGICVKQEVTPGGIITMGENLPEIHWESGKYLKELMGKAIKMCPDKCFVVRE